MDFTGTSLSLPDGNELKLNKADTVTPYYSATSVSCCSGPSQAEPRTVIMKGNALIDVEHTTVRLRGRTIVHGAPIASGQAATVWRHWRSRQHETGLVPVITSQVNSVQALHALAERAATVEEMRPAAPSAVTEIVRRVATKSVAEAYPGEEEEQEDLHDPVRLARLLTESTGEKAEGNELAFIQRWGSRKLWLLLVEARDDALLPVMLPGFLSGGRTAYPDSEPISPSEHAAFLRHWGDQYGAEVFFMNAVEVQLLVKRPPVNLSEIAVLAVEQNAYCDDLHDAVEMGDGQARSNVWNFWWD
jgi:hypothetical protein